MGVSVKVNVRDYVMSKIITFPKFEPKPTPPNISVLLRVLRRIIAVWKNAMSAEYPTLPTVIPTWWTVDRVLHFANGGDIHPVFVATRTRVSSVRRVGGLAA